jgi:hypothetical protein
MDEQPGPRPLPAAPAPTRIRAWAGQGLLYGLFALAIGVFSHWPIYRHLAGDQALIKLSFTHTGKPVGDCRPLSAAELARLPPNMRAPMKCPRERSAVTVEVDIGGMPALRRVAPPSGLSHDGASAVYQRLQVPAGEQRIAVRLNDDARHAGFAYQREATLTLAPAQILVIDFDAEKGGITLR